MVIKLANKPVKETAPVAVFTKEQIVASAKYSNRKDLVTALLDDGEQYTLEQVDEVIEKFMKGKVN